MDGDLTQFLERHEPRTDEIVDWGDMPLRITSYITSECSPLAYVTSVRALVIGRDTVLTLFDGVGTHILPGGRRETGE